jgi:hypothetical protein
LLSPTSTNAIPESGDVFVDTGKDAATNLTAVLIGTKHA